MRQPVHVVAVLEARDGDVDALRRYESKVLPILAEHGGQLLAAFEPDAEQGDEVHVLRFPDHSSLDAYRNDARVLELANERSNAIARSTVLVGERTVDYDLST